MGRKKSDPVFPSGEGDELDTEEESSELEASFLDSNGSGATTHGRRVRGRGLDENELGDLPDEAPPGWPG